MQSNSIFQAGPLPALFKFEWQLVIRDFLPKRIKGMVEKRVLEAVVMNSPCE